MRLPLSSIPQTKVGTCPHGLPQGACPICSGMGGGGGSASMKKANKNEMSWSECYVAWQQMLKAKDLKNTQSHNHLTQAQMLSQHKLQMNLVPLAEKMGNISAKMADFIQNAKPNSTIGTKILALGARIALPVLNTLKSIVEFAGKTVTTFKEKMADISDKLNAIFGELKNSTEKKISDRLKDFKKKIKTLFGVLDAQDTDEIDDEEKRIEESKRLFELKTVLHSIKEKFSKKEKENEK